ncbi:MAG: transglycosylase SLT domain-containing protein [Alphaproteobacteria bacterium]|nr:transglycosylase SLT domain-containing protein [Alphaproteobacteria bacterium]
MPKLRRSHALAAFGAAGALAVLLLPPGAPLTPATAQALTPPSDTGELGPVTVLPEATWAPVLPLDDALVQALAQRKHGDAVELLSRMGTSELPGRAVGDHAFLQAWSLIRADRAEKAVPLLDVVRESRTAPAPYLHLTLGEILVADGRFVDAVAELEQVDDSAVIWPRARLALADALFQAGRTADSLAVYEALAARPDPAEGSAVALSAIATRRGDASPAGQAALRRLYRHYAGTPEGRAAGTRLGTAVTRADKAWHADGRMESWSFEAATDLLAPVIDSWKEADAEACIAWYAYGRSQFKRNNVSLAAQVLEPAGEKCKGIDDDRGAKALYIAGKSLERKKEWEAAARAYEQIPALYPDHSMADDGYALAGIAWQTAGFPEKARPLWEAQVAEHPDGDLAGEGFWRLAWLSYLEGQPDQAIHWAEQMLWQVPLAQDPVHVTAAQYWSARWRIHPDVRDPSAFHPDAGSVSRGIELLLQLCAEHPWSFYSLLASARLYELAPDRLAAIPRPPAQRDVGGWTVRQEWLAADSTAYGLALARLGLVQESLAELSQFDRGLLTPSEYAIQAEVLERSAPADAHDRLHRYLLEHPLETLGADRDRMIAQAWPDLYWSEVQEAATGYGYDPRVFHALVREESSFNPRAVSHAGARGLCQLMPRTGTHVAGKMGLRVGTNDLFDPMLNLRIGTNYYDSLVRRFDGNLFLSTPAYNAGEGNVEKWLAERGRVPTDEFVEHIPLRETRHYVKRVMGTWQVYRVAYDSGPLFPDLSAYNHVARE